MRSNAQLASAYLHALLAQQRMLFSLKYPKDRLDKLAHARCQLRAIRYQ